MKTKELLGSSPYGDWQLAFDAAGVPAHFYADADVLWSSEGENDGSHWQAILRDETGIIAVDAWCDYTGWDCQSGGEWKDCGTEEAARAWLNRTA